MNEQYIYVSLRALLDQVRARRRRPRDGRVSARPRGVAARRDGGGVTPARDRPREAPPGARGCRGGARKQSDSLLPSDRR